ncbi:hypothetical protein C8F01DRAFT_452914 [Mycena amicta]|nr:hypothetical protein C8F01DRAFT_452914 [Mycena amicta]
MVLPFMPSPQSKDVDIYDEHDIDSVPLIERTSSSAQTPTRGSSLLNPRLKTGFDRPLLFLLVNGILAVLWGIALAIFASGVVPISWNLSQYGTQHDGITNVVITGVSTLATAQLQYTIQNAVREYAAAMLYEGFTLRRWKWMQGFAEGSIWPPFAWRRHPFPWIVWLVVYGSMAGHSASLVAILQPEPFFDHVLFNDRMPCGVDTPALNFDLPEVSSDALTQLDQASVSMGVQLGTFYEQVAGNTSTSVVGRVFTKDTFAYGALGGLWNGLQEVPGVEFTAQCGDSKSSPSLESLWSAAGIPLPTLNVTNGTGSFTTALKSNSTMEIVTSSPLNETFSLATNSPAALFSVIQVTGSGALLTINSTNSTTGCTWTTIPRLVHVQMINFTASALPFETRAENASTYPAPIGHAVASTMRGIAQAILLGGTITPRPDANLTTIYYFPSTSNHASGTLPSTATMLSTLLADGAKACFTGYSNYFAGNFFYSPIALPASVAVCGSNNRTVQLHWRFGNVHGLGTVAIILNIGFGMFAVWVVSALAWRRRTRVKGVNALEVVDAFRLGVATGIDAKSGGVIEGTAQVLRVRDGRVVVHG